MDLNLLVEKFPDLNVCVPDLKKAFEILRACFSQGGKLLVCGNGGSAADSEHIVGELMKGFLLERPLPRVDRRKLLETYPEEGLYLAGCLQGALPAISLSSQTSLLTAFSNDVAPDMAFAQQVYGYGRAGDVLLAISTSGNSPNILHAIQVARAFSLHTIGLTGGGGGAMTGLCEVTICVPATRAPEIQERHVVVYHALCAMLEGEFFGDEGHLRD